MTVKTLEKLIKIEQEFLKIKREGGLFSQKIPVSLKGILKGVKITDKDIKVSRVWP